MARRSKAKRRKRAAVEPAGPPAPECEADDCAAFPFYGVQLPDLPRKIWLCTRHQFVAYLDVLKRESREALIRANARLFVESDVEPIAPPSGRALEHLARVGHGLNSGWIPITGLGGTPKAVSDLIAVTEGLKSHQRAWAAKAIADYVEETESA